MATLTVGVRLYDLLERAVEEGTRRGIRLAYKHSDVAPDDDEQIRVSDCVIDAVMLELTEVLDFGGDNEN